MDRTIDNGISLTRKGVGSDVDRVRRQPWLARALKRPELGAISGVVVVYLFFAVVAGQSGMFSAAGMVNIFQVSAELGVLAVAAAMLMIAGEFDLSIGSIIAFSGLVIGISVTQLHLPLSVAVLLAFVFSVGIGFVNGLLVVKTGLPSFIVTLASMFILRGLSVGATRWFTGRTQIPYITEGHEGWILMLFGGHVGQSFFVWLAAHGMLALKPDGTPAVDGIPVSILWWIGLTAVATWVLLRTRFGNWIFAVGGDNNAARNVGVPVAKVKISLFILTALASTLFATLQVLESGSADTLRGVQKEFEAIIAVVIGGTLLTGGYGSAVGAMLGALVFGTVQIGIFYTGIDTDWFKVFLGAMVLVAVLFNNYVRRRATQAR